MPQRRAGSVYGWELKAIFSFGVIFALIMILIAITVPRPTEFQQLVFRVVLALAAAGVAPLLPGFLTIKYKNILRAGGALAVFAIVYFVNPATFVIAKPPTNAILPTDPFEIIFMYDRHGTLVANSYDFPVSDIRKNKSGTEFLELLGKLPNLPKDSLANSTIFRTSDEKILTKNHTNVLEGDNLGVLVIPKSAIEKYDDHHSAFTHIYSQVRKNK